MLNMVFILKYEYVFNRCESFSTYPRTYDLLHAWTILSDVEKKGCSVVDLSIEMDRILRPQGFIIVRDKQSTVDYVKKYIPALHWEAIGVGESLPDSDEEEDMTVLLIQKKIWPSNESVRNSE